MRWGRVEGNFVRWDGVVKRVSHNARVHECTGYMQGNACSCEPLGASGKRSILSRSGSGFGFGLV